MTRKEQEELTLIKENISVDLFNRQVTFKYPHIKDINLLHDNRRQAISIATKLEARLKAMSELADYKKELQEFIGQGVLRELTKEELENREGPIDYISHHGVLKPGSSTNKLRVVSNSSLDNNNSGLSLNDCLPKGPNTLVPLIQPTIAWRSYQHCVVWDLSKAYNVMHSVHCTPPSKSCTSAGWSGDWEMTTPTGSPSALPFLNFKPQYISLPTNITRAL